MKLNAEINKALAATNIKERFAAVGAQPAIGNGGAVRQSHTHRIRQMGRSRQALGRKNRLIQPSQSLRVLVVDDNLDSAETMATLLSLQGHDVRTVHDGALALEEVTRFQPDVGILDIGMPKMNGYTVARGIRELMSEAQPLLIAVTGWVQEEYRQRSRAARFDHHLVKPVDPAHLISLLGTRPAPRTLH
jgi:CheY-like chemotaxis protein